MYWRRLLKEKSRCQDSTGGVMLRPVNEVLNRWHFTFRGPPNSVYQDGVYHGLLMIPEDYPFSPPNIVLFTRSGRYSIHQKICLTITGFHPEQWSPALNLEKVVRALRSQFQGKTHFPNRPTYDQTARFWHFLVQYQIDWRNKL